MLPFFATSYLNYTTSQRQKYYLLFRYICLTAAVTDDFFRLQLSYQITICQTIPSENHISPNFVNLFLMLPRMQTATVKLSN